MAALVWFRLDLRLADNPALTVAAKRGGPVVPVFIWSPEEEAPWAPGAASRWWLHHSLAALDRSLRDRGSRLILRRGPTLPVLRELMRETGADEVLFNRRYEPAVVARDRKVAAALPCSTFKSALLIEPWELKPYRVFTPFWRACCQQLDAAGEPRSDKVGALKPLPHWPESVKLAELGLLPAVDWAKDFPWTPGEGGALRRLRRFRATDYAARRDRPDLQGTSRLSPHLHFGEISPRRVWSTGKAAFQRQLIWREFAYHLLHHFSHTPERPLRPEFERFPWRCDRRMLRAWQRGRTGYPLVDAGMGELWTTGWMHNRVRMVAASFLVKDLMIPWQEGARWFWDTLVDADLANNTLGWQWVAGCGADATPFFRVFNPESQAEKFDPAGDYVRRWAKGVRVPVVSHARARERVLDAYERWRKATKRAE